MKELEFKILSVFKTKSKDVLSTSEIVSQIFNGQSPEEGLPAAKTSIYDQEGKAGKNSKNGKEPTDSREDDTDGSGLPKSELSQQDLKAQQHRKILYYLNKLIAEGILELSREGAKGEKFFKLALADSERFVIDKNKKRIIIEKSVIPAMPIEGYEQKGYLYRHDPITWIDRLNSILLDSVRFADINDYYKTIIDCFSYVNDVVALNNFETIIQNNLTQSIIELLSKLEAECKDYGRRLCCIIDLTNIKGDGAKIIEVLECTKELKRIDFIFDMTSNEIREKIGFFEKVIETLARNRQKLYFKNQDIHPAPYIIGSVGPYTFNTKEWLTYKKKLNDTSVGIACTHASITVDVFKFFSDRRSASEFRSLLLSCAKALLTANSLQRRKSSEFLRTRLHTMPNFFEYSRNYIRFWNYGWKQPGIETEDMLELIRSTKEEIDHFSKTEETIYQSCGMPTRFKIAFSCALREFLDESLSKAVFERLVVKRMDDLYSPQLKDIMVGKEKVFEIFDGGDRLRLVRSGKINPAEILREINVILTGYKLPFVCYDFTETISDVSLNKFI
jgi:hypothetical protein